jgi:uncharacterized membrane protein
MTIALVRTPERRLLIAALLVRLVPAALIFGSDDVEAWRRWGGRLLEGLSPYGSSFPIAWPPLWLPVTAFAVSISETLHLPFHFVAKVPSILADVIIAFLLYAVAERYGRSAQRTALAYALNPISIYTTSVHGNFDSFPLLCAMVAALLYAPDVEGDPRGFRAGGWLGAGAAFKTWPLLVLPALLTPSQSNRRRAIISGTAVAFWLIALLLPWPFFGRSSIAFALTYRGLPGWWGLTSLPSLLPVVLSERTVTWIFYAAMGLATLAVWKSRATVPTAVLFLLLTFFVASPGCAPQNFIWIVPIALIADPRRATAYTVLATAILSFELLFRPYTGFLGDTVRMFPHPGYARALDGPLDHPATVIDRLPLWVFCCWWWGATLGRMVRIPLS